MSVDGDDGTLSRDFGISAELGVCEYAGQLSRAHPAAINKACFHIISILQFGTPKLDAVHRDHKRDELDSPVTRPIARALVRPPEEPRTSRRFKACAILQRAVAGLATG